MIKTWHEPVAWWDPKLGVFDEKHFDQLQPLYTAPPKREWVGLSDDEREHFRKLGFVGVLAVENRLKEKNT